MQAKIEARLVKLTDLANRLDVMGWQAADPVRLAQVGEAKEAVIARIEQAARILRTRYGVWM